MNPNPICKISWSASLPAGRSIALIALMLLGAVRCETRFNESAPGSFSTSGMTLEQRVESKKQIDNRLAQIKVSADQVRALIATFRTEQNKGIAGNVYTPIDFLFDINEALTGKIPEQRDLANTQKKTQVLVRNTAIRVPIESLSEECKTVQAQLRTEVTTDSQSQTIVTESGIKYLIKTCKTNGEFVPVVSATWSGQSITLGFNNLNLSSLFQDIVKSKIDANGVCATDFTENGILQSITCQNMNVGLSKTEFSVIRNLNFSNSGDQRFALLADIFDRDTGILKGSTQASMGRDGRMLFQARKAGSQESGPAIAEPMAPTAAAVPAPAVAPAPAPATAPIAPAPTVTAPVTSQGQAS